MTTGRANTGWPESQRSDASFHIPIRRLSPLVNPPNDWLVCVITGYYDGSNANGLVSLGGYVATLARWEKFEKEWPTVLAGRVPGVHMRDLYSLRDERAFKGVSQDVALRVVSDCVEYLSAQHKLAFRRYSCVVKLADFKRAKGEGILGLRDKTPEDICVDHCVGRLFTPRLREPNDPEKNTQLYFDGNERFCHRINRVFERERRKKLGWTKYVRNISPVDNSDNAVTPLQAADILVWVARKYRDDVNPATGINRGWHTALCEQKPEQTNSHDFFGYDALVAKYGTA